MATLGQNIIFQIYNADGTPFDGLILHKSTSDSVVMSLGDKITGDVYYAGDISLTMQEYIVVKNNPSDDNEEGIKYILVNPPTKVKEGTAAENSQLKGMTKYTFVFYHPMCMLSNFPFTDVAVTIDQRQYLSESKVFSWIGYPDDFIAKLNKNLVGTEWIVEKSTNFPLDVDEQLSEVIPFDNATIADALKTGYDTWGVPYVTGQVLPTETAYASGKRFKVIFGLPFDEIYEDAAHEQAQVPFVFHYGQGLGLKNNSRTPRNNKIITRISGYGSERNIPYGYPQIIWYGDQRWDYTEYEGSVINYDSEGKVTNTPKSTAYPIYKGIVGGAYVKLIKHPFTRKNLMPKVYSESVFNKVSPYAEREIIPAPEYTDTLTNELAFIDGIIAESSGNFKAIMQTLRTTLVDVATHTSHYSVTINTANGEGAVHMDDRLVMNGYVQEIGGGREFEFEDIYNNTHEQPIQPNPNYNPNTRLVDFYDAIPSEEYQYPNPIVPSAPSYESHQFEDIKPELDADRNLGIISAIPLNADLTPADDWDDTMDDDGNYLQSYFQITLPQLTFDLYACASITEEMYINMRGGACIGCTFPVQVDWDDYKSNFFDNDGNFIPYGNQRNFEKYPDSSQQQISIIVQKDNNTFGTLMPNVYQNPAEGDTFVVLGISLPLSYIKDAEERLENESKAYMLENNIHYFDYPLKFDEHFLATHQYILSKLKTNSIVRFDYNGEEKELYVKQLTIKYGESSLPKYDITLTDNIEIVLNQIGQAVDGVEKLGSLVNALRREINEGSVGDVSKKLSRVSDDIAQGKIRFAKGIEIGSQFISGILGSGGCFRKESDGTTYIEADKMYVRMKAYFDSVEIREYKYTGGNRIASVAGNKAVRVEWIKIVDGQETILDQETASASNADFFRCYFRAYDGEDTVRNNFVAGDMVYCHITSIAGSSDNPEQKGLNQKHYWRLCIGRNVDGNLTDDGEAWIDISNRSTETIDNVSYAGYQSGSDYPDAQDSMIQLGNVNDNTRQGAIIEFVTGADAPSYQIYQGIGADSSNIYSLNNKNQVGFGYNSATGHAYMNVFGDAYIGDRNGTTFVKYEQNNPTTHAPKLTIKAEIEAQSTIGGQSIDDYIAGNEAINNMIEGLQDQIDGAIETYFLEGTPSLQTPPVVNPQGGDYPTPWLDGTETAAEREKILNRHLSDMYYDIADPDDSQTSGFAYRFIKDANNNYTWQYIDDTAITAALAKAAQALSVADSKAKVFKTASGVLPPAPYKVNDIWVNATGTWGTGASAVTWNNEILKCITACPSTGTPDISHWDKASKYTDDTYAHGFDYISSNLARLSSTEIAGGLVLSSLIGLRDSNQNIQSGISGIIDSTQGGKKGGGIAAWFGGEQGDKEDQNNYSGITRWAKSILRFDGSGYLANGNITWDATGKVTIKDLHTDDGNLSVDVLQEMTSFRSMFDLSLWQSTSRISPLQNFDKVKITHSNGYTFTDNDVLNRVENDARYMIAQRFFDLFDIYNGSTNYTNTYKTSGLPSDTSNISIKAKFGLWTDSFLSALGLNPNSGGGGGGGIDMTQVWSALAASTTEQINVTHLGTALSNFSTKVETIQDIQNNGNKYLVTRANGTTFNIDAARAIDISDYFSGGYMSIGDGYMYYYNGTPLEIRKYSETTSTTITYLVFAERRGDYNPNSHYASSFPYPYEVHLFTCVGTTMCEYVDTYSWSDASSIIKKLWGDGLYLPLGGGTMDSTTLVTNLNADLLDGHHASEFLLLTGGTITGTLAVQDDVTIGGIGRLGNYGHLDVYNGISSKTEEEDFDTGDTYTVEVCIDSNAIDFKYGSTTNRLKVSRTSTDNGRLLYSNNVLAYKTEVPTTLDNLPDGTNRKLSDYFKRIEVGRLPDLASAINGAIYVVSSDNPNTGNAKEEWYRISVVQLNVNGEWIDTVYKGEALGWYPADWSVCRDSANEGDVLLDSDAVGTDDSRMFCEIPYDGVTHATWGSFETPIGTIYKIGLVRYVYLSTGWTNLESLTTRSGLRWEKIGENGGITKIIAGSNTYNAVGDTITLPAYLPLAGGTVSGSVRFGTKMEIYNGQIEFSNDNFDTMPSDIHWDFTNSRLVTGGSASGYTFAYTSDIPDLTGYATQTWVQNQGYLTSSAISDMATQTWVGQQGYVTSSALNGYATQSWVQQQGYLTSLPSHNHDGRYYISNGTIYLGNSSITPITSLSGYATQSWVQQQGYITSYTNTARMQVSDTTNKRINTQESTGNFIQFSGGTNKFTVSDGTNSFDVAITPSVTFPVTSVVGQTGAVTTAQIASALTSAGYKLTDTVYSLPLAADGTRGGVQIGYAQNGQNYPVQLSGEKMYVNVPWTDHTYNLSNYISKSSDTLAGDWRLSYPNSDTLDGHYIGGSHIDVFNLVNEGYDDGFSVRLDIMRPQNEDSSNPDFSCWVRLPYTEVEGNFYASGYIEAVGGIYGNGFHKTNSNDNYVLLGGGGHALISGLSVAYAASAGSATDSTKLPLSGGTMTGGINFSISGSNRNAIALRKGVYEQQFGWSWDNNDGAGLGVYNSDAEGVDKGCFYLYTSNGSNHVYLNGRSDGTLTWNGNHVIHTGNIGSQSVNYATSAGNAATATSLQTARTIWGQSFDGTGNVDGSLYIGDNILSTRTSNFHIGFETEIDEDWDYNKPYLYFDYEDHYVNMSCGTSTNYHVGFDSDGWLYEYFGYVFKLRDNANNADVIEYDSDYGTPLSLLVNTKVTGGLQVGTSSARKSITCYGTIKSNNTYSASLESYSSYSQLYFSHSTGGGYIKFETWSNSYQLAYYAGGMGGDGRHFFDQNVYIDGSCDATSHPTHSDARLKNIYDYNALVPVNTIAMAPAIRFTWKDGVDKDLHCGTLAQYWQAVMPECVINNADGYLSMQYDVISLLAAISIARNVVNHEERIKELEKENQRLRTELEQIRSLI